MCPRHIVALPNKAPSDGSRGQLSFKLVGTLRRVIPEEDQHADRPSGWVAMDSLKCRGVVVADVTLGLVLNSNFRGIEDGETRDVSNLAVRSWN